MNLKPRNPVSRWPVTGPFGWILTASQQLGVQNLAFSCTVLCSLAILFQRTDCAVNTDKNSCMFMTHIANIKFQSNKRNGKLKIKQWNMFMRTSGKQRRIVLSLNNRRNDLFIHLFTLQSAVLTVKQRTSNSLLVSEINASILFSYCLMESGDLLV
jgi:hypothetical protein